MEVSQTQARWPRVGKEKEAPSVGCVALSPLTFGALPHLVGGA